MYCDACAFQSTLPLRGATLSARLFTISSSISIHTPLAGSDDRQSHVGLRVQISIHTPLAGSDPAVPEESADTGYFNPHSPCGERRTQRRFRIVPDDFNPHSPCGERLLFATPQVIAALFQSTLPLRGATRLRRPPRQVTMHFNPHSPCGERPVSQGWKAIEPRFQSTLPLRGATG